MDAKHRHEWEETGRAVTTHLSAIEGKINGFSAQEFERLVFGLTVIALKCKVCGDMKSVEMLGRHHGR